MRKVWNLYQLSSSEIFFFTNASNNISTSFMHVLENSAESLVALAHISKRKIKPPTINLLTWTLTSEMRPSQQTANRIPMTWLRTGRNPVLTTCNPGLSQKLFASFSRNLAVSLMVMLAWLSSPLCICLRTELRGHSGDNKLAEVNITIYSMW